MKYRINSEHQTKSIFSNKKGQVLVEYMLLLLISVSFATLLMSKLISRKEGDSQGVIIKSWSKMLETLGNDLPDCPKQTDFNSPKCN